MTKHRAILIAGPTASGKSALAIALALRHGGVIINADSLQVYRDLEILTARPSATDLARCPHLLYGTVDGGEAYSVGRWLADARVALEHAWQSGATPVVVGGTGLYFKALLEGLAPIPDIPDAVRRVWRSEAMRLSAAALHAILAARDPETAARLQPADRQRVTRAIEVIEATGRGLSDWQKEPGTATIKAEEAMLLVAAPERNALYDRADRRFDHMLAAGAVEEVQRLAARGLTSDLPVMRALGVAPLMRAIAGQCTLAQAGWRAKLDTRHYIKRQMTWIRRNMISWKHLSAQQMDEFSN